MLKQQSIVALKSEYANKNGVLLQISMKRQQKIVAVRYTAFMVITKDEVP